MSTILGSGEHRYRVVENWAKLPDEVGQEIMLADLNGSKLSSRVWRGEEQPEGL